MRSNDRISSSRNSQLKGDDNRGGGGMRDSDLYCDELGDQAARRSFCCHAGRRLRAVLDRYNPCARRPMHARNKIKSKALSSMLT